VHRPFSLRCLLVSSALALAISAGGVALASEIPSSPSGNWGGYIATAGPTSARLAKHFTSVKGSWVEPTKLCSPERHPVGDQDFIWVGLGGTGGAKALEQIGVFTYCFTKGPSPPGYVPPPDTYFEQDEAMYELPPAIPVPITMQVHPGDSMTASVRVRGEDATVNLRDNTTGASFSKTVVMTAPKPSANSAEWVAEAPSNGTYAEPVPLTNFGKVTFTSASASSVGSAGSHTGPINDQAWTSYQKQVLKDTAYAPDTGLTLSTGLTPIVGENCTKTSPLRASGSSFTITYIPCVPAKGPTVTITNDIASIFTTSVSFAWTTRGTVSTTSCSLTGESEGKQVMPHGPETCDPGSAQFSDLVAGVVYTFTVTVTGPNGGTGYESDQFIVQ
jgi:hypothetical protein